MDAEKAGKIGRAFALGYGHGVLMGRSENEITSLAWEREQARRHRNFMTNTFGDAS